MYESITQTTEPEAIEQYATDESSIFTADIEKIDAVLYPRSEEEVAEILRESNRTHTKVTVSGAGTGVTGSRVPMAGGLVISVERMDSPIGQLDMNSLRVSSPPGVSLEALDRALPKDLFYPPDPTEKSALLGGTVATNASGARSLYYGPTRRWVHSLRAALPNGDILSLSRGEIFADDDVLKFESESGKKYQLKIPQYKMPSTKNAAGLYSKPGMDLIDLFIGSEGILVVFTEIEVKIAESPGRILGEMVFFGSDDDALSFVDGVRTERPLSLEYFDRHSLAFISEKYGSLIESDDEAAVFFEFIAPEDESILVDRIAVWLESYDVTHDWYADTPRHIEDQKSFRHALPEGINEYLRENQSYKLGTDFAVPKDKFTEMMRQYEAAGKQFRERFPREGAHHMMFGHIGDYHVHFNFITNTEEETEYARKLYMSLAEKAVSLDGTISAEHGVGKKTVLVNDVNVPYLHLMYGEHGLAEIERVKKVFDPNHILNVGNMIS